MICRLGYSDRGHTKGFVQKVVATSMVLGISIDSFLSTPLLRVFEVSIWTSNLMELMGTPWFGSSYQSSPSNFQYSLRELGSWGMKIIVLEE